MTMLESLKRDRIANREGFMKWRFRDPLPKYDLIKTIFEVEETKERISLTPAAMAGLLILSQLYLLMTEVLLQQY